MIKLKWLTDFEMSVMVNSENIDYIHHTVLNHTKPNDGYRQNYYEKWNILHTYGISGMAHQCITK